MSEERCKALMSIVSGVIGEYQGQISTNLISDLQRKVGPEGKCDGPDEYRVAPNTKDREALGRIECCSPPGTSARKSPTERAANRASRPALRFALGSSRHDHRHQDPRPQAQHLSGRPRRAGFLRPVRRPLRRRDADAADPRAGARLRGGQGRSRLPARARPAQHALRRPAEPALFRRAPDAASRRRQNLLQARRAQPHRQPQDQQLPGPDPAGPAHGQDAHHRRDRRRPARRGRGHRVRQASACPARSSWAPSTSSGRSPTCSA